MGDHGNLDFDWRKRCVATIPGSAYRPEHQLVLYGLTAKDLEDIGLVAFDLDSPWTKDFQRGRRPGYEYAESKHYFNQRVEVSYAAGVSPIHPAAGERAQDGARGASRTAQPEDQGPWSSDGT